MLVALPAAHCGLAETASVARSLALESAGQCGPCFNGLPAIAAALAELAQPRPGRPALANLQRWAGLVAGRGACHHPDGTVRFVASALTVFGAEIAEHASGRCTATRRDPFLPRDRAGADRVRLEMMMPDTSVRLRVNRVACSGHGVCAELLPELIALDEWGYPLIADTAVPARLARARPASGHRLPRARAAAHQRSLTGA